ncbi:hypothetical protein A3Q56_06458, partial [Intoshia linei]
NINRGDYGSKVDSVYWDIQNRNQELLALVPVYKILELMQELHNGFGEMHVGTLKLVDLLSQKFFWTGFVDDIRFYVSCCVNCMENKNGRRKHENELRLVVTTKINDLWQLDIAGQLPRVLMERNIC